MKWLWTRYTLNYPRVILYMLQSSDYIIPEYLKWINRTKDFRTVVKRRTLDMTPKIKLLASAMIIMSIFVVVFGVCLIITGGAKLLMGSLLIIALPWILSYAIIVPLWVGYIVVQKPNERRLVALAHQKLANHNAIKIAIAGSFGKTTAKEILSTILREGRKVAATPGNMNTLIGTSRFIQSLDGDEEIIIFELGESHIGDIKELCELVRPDMGVITGINEAHLSSFGSIENTIATIFELQDFLGHKPLYKNKDSRFVAETIDTADPLAYSTDGVNGWVVTDVETNLSGTKFSIQKESKVVWAKTNLIGKHMIGVLSVGVAIADSLGLATSQISNGLKKIRPFEHRMQPRKLNGTLLIDDTYNGNIEGVNAGLTLLKESDAKRRVYVTPGLVELGSRTKEIHEQIGERIAESADVVVLMKNSVTDYISDGLQNAGFKGRLLIIDDPLEFYTNIEHFIVEGDVVLMQNDWTDNYS